jgi:DUF1680 family protein
MFLYNRVQGRLYRDLLKANQDIQMENRGLDEGMPCELQAQRQTRRKFMKRSLAALALATSANSMTAARGSVAAERGAVSGATLFEPAGELQARIALTQMRLTGDGIPAFTPAFILADVALDPGYPRRFSNYSGDLSGRYFGALALMPTAGGIDRVADILHQALRYQRQDGRFGDAGLSFSASAIDDAQMALLWGNGRLLVGLLEYHRVRPSPEILRAARRLGDFLISIRERCSDPETARRLAQKGASGYICFTQLIEPLVLLGRQTGDGRYLEAASRIVPLLQPRGTQHSHGYLTTLRGILDLHAAAGEKKLLDVVEEAFRDLVSSRDYQIYGGVHEYFGVRKDATEAADRTRDEGCSEADFLRLSLSLFRVTGKQHYLELAELCLLNAFFFNQFDNGDFGHHTAFGAGFRPSESIGRAWWCCTMHGLRAFRDVLEAVVTADQDQFRIHLFFDGSWSGSGLKLKLERGFKPVSSLGVTFSVLVEEAKDEMQTIALRIPSWAARHGVLLNGTKVTGHVEDGYFMQRRRWQRGDRLDLQYDYRLQFRNRGGQQLTAGEFKESIAEAALFCGPYLLGADSTAAPEFFAEPWQGRDAANGNCLLIPSELRAGEIGNRRIPLTPYSVPQARCGFQYTHGGFPGQQPVTMRPISEQTGHPQHVVAYWLNFRRVIPAETAKT